MDKEVPN